MNLLRVITSTARRVVREVADAPRIARELRQIRAERQAVPAPLLAADVDQVPEVDDIEEAARSYDQARLATNSAARIKRAAEKVLKRTPDGRHGSVMIERYESSRQVADLDAIKTIFQRHGLGDVPMKRCAPSLTISWIAEEAQPAPLAAVA